MFQQSKQLILSLSLMVISNNALSFEKTYEDQLFSKGEVKVTIENLTLGQVLTPPVIKLSGQFINLKKGKTTSNRLFQVGQKSSQALKLLAEEGDTSLYQEDEFQVIGKSPILPGKSVVLNAKLPFHRFGASISLISMLANTNDAFIGLDIFRLEGLSGFGTVLHEMKVGEKITTLAKVYDAGTEYNSELCVHIPGPQCGGKTSSSNKPGEGRIQFHPGLMFKGDLTPKNLFSPTAGARITIERIN